ncbi:MAG: hypothetical protein QNJ00_07075 [Woeseiaceae bacterium]|nr:hypothetical protein [Woeseiaceae bacterium]
MFSELVRRNVLRVAIAYAAIAWLILQIAETVLPIIDAPEYLLRWLLLLLAVGFPIAILVSWFYEWTSQGIVSTKEADAAGLEQPTGFGRTIDFVIIVLLLIAVAWLVYDRERIDADFSVAVLPLTNTSPDTGLTYLSDGISLDLMSMLGQVDGLKVAGRASSFQFRDGETSPLRIGEILGVAAILDGSVRQTSDTLSINAQLTSTSTGHIIWSELFSGSPEHLLMTLEMIAETVAREMSAYADEPSKPLDIVQPLATTDAYLRYQQGRYELDREFFSRDKENTDPEAVERALAHFDASLEIAPDFAPAWAGRAQVLRYLAFLERMPFEEAGPQIEESIVKALEYGDDLAEILFVAAEISNSVGDSLQYLDRALERNDNLAAAHNLRVGLLGRQRRYQEAFEAAEQAFELDPLNMFASDAVLYADFYRGRLEDLDERIATTVANSPTANGLVVEAHMAFERGQFDRFVDLQERADKLPGLGVSDWFASAPRHFGDTYLTLGMVEEARRWLDHPDMVASYPDVIDIYEDNTDQAIAFLWPEYEVAQGRGPHMYRWAPDIVASATEAYLYAGRYEELVAMWEQLGWGPRLYPLPNCCRPNPPWPEAAHTFALYQVGQTEKADEWLASQVEELEDRFAQDIRAPNHYYELARLRSMQNRLPEALEALATAVDLGWRRWYFDKDPILEPVRQLPGFAELKVRYDADIERMRAALEK